MEDKKYSLGGFTFDTQQEYERAKVELQVILKIKQKYDINNPEDAKNVLDAVNKKGDVFKSSVGKAFINKLKRVSKNGESGGTAERAVGYCILRRPSAYDGTGSKGSQEQIPV